jgi:hypothetical protein
VFESTGWQNRIPSPVKQRTGRWAVVNAIKPTCCGLSMLYSNLQTLVPFVVELRGDVSVGSSVGVSSRKKYPRLQDSILKPRWPTSWTKRLR